MKIITIGSRRSLLAQTQSKLIRKMLLDAWQEIEVKIELINTRGDLNRIDPLPEIGGKGLFTLELENALRNKTIDIAVHSLKDLPVEDSPGLTVTAIPERVAAADLLVSHKAACINGLPQGAVVGTSSMRRAAQLLALRPDLKIKNIRGNVDTRLRKLDDPAQGYDAILLAQAGLKRLGYTFEHAHPIPYSDILPAPGQGALGVQGRVDDEEMDKYLHPLEHNPTRVAVTAERAFLDKLGGGCSLPVGALGQIVSGQLELKALVANPDGSRMITVDGSTVVDKAEDLGCKLAEEALSQGAGELLAGS